MKNHIVVAQYKENVNWINGLEDKYDIYLYHKEKGIPKEIEKIIKKINYIELPNVGRESHTYIHHILKHFNNLPDKIFFTQAEPFDHINREGYATPEFFKNQIEDFMTNDYSFKGYGMKHYIWKTGIGNKTPTMEKLHKDMFENEITDFYFNNGGIFGVKKEYILLRNTKFYDYSLKSLAYDKNPVEGFCFERLWAVIFDKTYKSKI